MSDAVPLLYPRPEAMTRYRKQFLDRYEVAVPLCIKRKWYQIRYEVLGACSVTT